MNDTFVNLNKITLYKTPMFNTVDTYLFENATERDNYFNSITSNNKLEIDNFHDLYEGCGITLPYNYLDLKKYNTMKLYYNDSLGHEQTYYCNVDNYLYVSTNACVPIYRIDYFLTYGHLLYGKNISMFMERRTLSENHVTRNDKADDITVPRIRYEKQFVSKGGIKHKHIPEEYPNEYIVMLNNSVLPGHESFPRSVTVKFCFAIGRDSNNEYVDENNFDETTIGCICLQCTREGLDYVLRNENADYIMDIIEIHNWINAGGPDYNEYGFRPLNDMYPKPDFVFQFNYDLYNDYTPYAYKPLSTDNIYPNNDKKVMSWLNCKGVMVQDFEYDPKDFDDNDLKRLDNVVKYDFEYHAGLYFYSFLGYTYCYPIGYRGEYINISNVIKWKSGKEFSYTTDYTKTLAYKELQEYNTQQTEYAIKNADISSYYAQQLASNQNAQLDISKQQNMISLRSQTNSLNNQIVQNNYQRDLLNISKTGDKINLVGGIAGAVGDLFTGKIGSAIGGVIGTIGNYGITTASKSINLKSINANNDLLSYQIDIAKAQAASQNRLLELQQAANSINARFQCDTIALTRDNTLANIAISNKYNNLRPGSFNGFGFNEISDYVFAEYIDTDDYTDFSQIINIRTHYNTYGIFRGYIDNWKPGQFEGLYFDYIKGEPVNNSNELIDNTLTTEIYTQLVTRLSNGLRIWNPKVLVTYNHETLLFGNLMFDNTYSNIPSYGNYKGELGGPTEEQKLLYQREWYSQIITQSITSSSYSTVNITNWNNLYTPPSRPTPEEGDKYNYLIWLGNGIPFGETPTGTEADDLRWEGRYIYNEFGKYNGDEYAIKIILSMTYLTINQMRYIWYQYLVMKDEANSQIESEE